MRNFCIKCLVLHIYYECKSMYLFCDIFKDFLYLYFKVFLVLESKIIILNSQEIYADFQLQSNNQQDHKLRITNKQTLSWTNNISREPIIQHDFWQVQEALPFTSLKFHSREFIQRLNDQLGFRDQTQDLAVLGKSAPPLSDIPNPNIYSLIQNFDSRQK